MFDIYVSFLFKITCPAYNFMTYLVNNNIYFTVPNYCAQYVEKSFCALKQLYYPLIKKGYFVEKRSWSHRSTGPLHQKKDISHTIWEEKFCDFMLSSRGETFLFPTTTVLCVHELYKIPKKPQASTAAHVAKAFAIQFYPCNSFQLFVCHFCRLLIRVTTHQGLLVHNGFLLKKKL